MLYLPDDPERIVPWGELIPGQVCAVPWPLVPWHWVEVRRWLALSRAKKALPTLSEVAGRFPDAGLLVIH